MMALFTLYVGDECAPVRDLHLSVLAIHYYYIYCCNIEFGATKEKHAHNKFYVCLDLS